MILDTCGLLGWLCTPDTFTPAIRSDLAAAMHAGRLGSCAVSIWEIAGKHRLGKLPLPMPLDELEAALRAVDLIAYPPTISCGGGWR